MWFLYALLIVSGIVFIVVQLFFSSGGKAKFKSDLPKAEKPKKRKGFVACSLILSVISLGLLTVAMISFLS